MAITYLLRTVPLEFRANVRYWIPFGTADFPLDSDAVAMENRRTAYRHFTAAAKVARELDCPQAARVDDEYALWLELSDHDPETSENGRHRLKAKLSDPKTALYFVPLAVQFKSSWI